MKIHIFYSHYNIQGTDNKFRPGWFDYEKCFVNLLNTIEGKDIDLHLIMDGKVKNNFISKYTDKYISHEIKGGNARDAGWQMFRIALEYPGIEENDLLYFLENDYLHVQDWDKYVLDLFSSFTGLNYISLYDHNDKYFLPMYTDLVSKIFVTDTCHWRTTPSTCGSFLVSKKIFSEDYQDHTTIEGDHNKWLAINESKQRFILTPIPGLSTHCMEGLLSPTVDWQKINNLQQYEKN